MEERHRAELAAKDAEIERLRAADGGGSLNGSGHQGSGHINANNNNDSNNISNNNYNNGNDDNANKFNNTNNSYDNNNNDLPPRQHTRGASRSSAPRKHNNTNSGGNGARPSTSAGRKHRKSQQRLEKEAEENAIPGEIRESRLEDMI
jgi:hypothetical protein